MLPWTIHGSENAETYNADISRAIAALLPSRSVNKERLAGVDFGSHLADSVMQRIESQWKEIGAERTTPEVRSRSCATATRSAPVTSTPITMQSLACHGELRVHTNQTFM
jgi:hypothetical protein